MLFEHDGPPDVGHALVTHVYADRHIALNAPEAVTVFPFDLVVNDPGGDVEIQDGLLHFLLEEPYRFGNGFFGSLHLIARPPALSHFFLGVVIDGQGDLESLICVQVKGYPRYLLRRILRVLTVVLFALR